VLFPGAGSELYRGLGSVVLGGLLVSTVVTLILVPTLFSLFMDVKSLLSGQQPRDRQLEPEAAAPVSPPTVVSPPQAQVVELQE
jgi:hypothetical protein